MIDVKRVAEEWKIWDKEEKTARLEIETKKIVLEKFHKWIKVFGKKQSERMPTRKVQDHTIDVKEGFVLRKGKVYLLLREEREEVCYDQYFLKVVQTGAKSNDNMISYVTNVSVSALCSRYNVLIFLSCMMTHFLIYFECFPHE